MANIGRTLLITLKATLTRASSGEEVSKDIDVMVGPREEYHYVSQQHITCVYNAEDDDLALFHMGEPLATDEFFSAGLPFDWKSDIVKGSLLQVRVKGFKTVFSSNLLNRKPRDFDLFYSV